MGKLCDIGAYDFNRGHFSSVTAPNLATYGQKWAMNQSGITKTDSAATVSALKAGGMIVLGYMDICSISCSADGTATVLPSSGGEGWHDYALLKSQLGTAGFMKDTSGNILYQSNATRIIIDFGSTAVQNYIKGQAQKAVAIGCDGFMLDDLVGFVPNATGEFLAGKSPRKTSTGALYTGAQWIADMNACIAAIASTGLKVTGNSMHGYSNPTNGDNGNATFLSQTGFVGGSSEASTSFFSGAKLTGTNFTNQMAWIKKFMDSGKWMLLNNYDTATASLLWQVAFYLMQKPPTSTSSTSAKLWLAQNSGNAGVTSTESGNPSNYWPGFDLDIGTPTEDMTASGGGYKRQYTKGYACINPSGGSVTFTLPRPMKQVTTAGTLQSTTMTSITLAAQTGAVFIDDSTVTTVTIDLTPPVSTMSVNETQQFTATTSDSSTPTYTTTAGTISNSGFFTAPSTAQTVTITAQTGSVSDTATVNVRAAIRTTYPKTALFVTGEIAAANMPAAATVAKYDVYVCALDTNRRNPGYFNSIRAANPNIRILAWMTPTQRPTDLSGFQASFYPLSLDTWQSLPETWLAKNAAATYVTKGSNYLMNLTSACPVSTMNRTQGPNPGSYTNVTYAQFIGEWIAAVLPSEGFDGVVLNDTGDNVTGQTPSAWDTDRNGTDESTQTISALGTTGTLWELGVRSLYQRIRTRWTNALIVMGLAHTPNGSGSSGRIFENASDPLRSGTFAYDIIGPDPYNCYVQFEDSFDPGHSGAGLDTPVIIPVLNKFGDTTGRTAAEFQRQRYHYAQALLDNGFVHYNGASGYDTALLYDEILGGTLNTYGYLGTPVAVNPTKGQITGTYSGGVGIGKVTGTGVYRRDFANGIVLVNPAGNGVQTVSLGTSFRKLIGLIETAVNNGNIITSISLQDRDGIILMNPSAFPAGNTVTGSNTDTVTISDAVSGTVSQTTVPDNFLNIIEGGFVYSFLRSRIG